MTSLKRVRLLLAAAAMSGAAVGVLGSIHIGEHGPSYDGGRAPSAATQAYGLHGPGYDGGRAPATVTLAYGLHSPEYDGG